jgi:hypothetical protein
MAEMTSARILRNAASAERELVARTLEESVETALQRLQAAAFGVILVLAVTLGSLYLVLGAT